MAVNSISFLIFFTVVFIVYYLATRNAKLQNAWLLVCSYFYYGYVEWRMLPLLIIATCLFYGLGLAIGHYNGQDEKKASALTTVGVLAGVGVLLYFKYLNFFIESFSSFFNAIGLHSNLHTFNIIMPLGISFFTFKLISYVIEVHRGHIEPCKDWIAFGTYVAFFPTIMSGPIDRPKQFLGQLTVNRPFNYDMAVDGSRQILWGMFKKMVVADNLADITADAWTNYQSTPGIFLILCAVLYTLQMYADFSGYSDMAIGVGKLLGIKIAKNFNYPFFATNVAEYWRRWHMSLTSWLTDYVFMPLNVKFRNWGQWGLIAAIIINLVAVGMWHGANYTYAVFGLYHGLLFIPLIVSGTFAKKQKEQLNRYGLPKWSQLRKMIQTFALVTLGLIVFAAPTISDAGNYILYMVANILDIPSIGVIKAYFPVKTLLFALIIMLLVILAEWKSRKLEYALCLVEGHQKVVRWTVYQILMLSILLFQGDTVQFIYVQF